MRSSFTRDYTNPQHLNRASRTRNLGKSGLAASIGRATNCLGNASTMIPATRLRSPCLTAPN
jgi:hypothetical protein